jgi:hypothetical protein
MKRPTDLRWAILSSLVLLGLIVVVGIVRPPSARETEPRDTGAGVRAEAESRQRTVFPLRSAPRGRTRPIDDAFQPTVGEEDGAPIAF